MKWDFGRHSWVIKFVKFIKVSYVTKTFGTLKKSQLKLSADHQLRLESYRSVRVKGGISKRERGGVRGRRRKKMRGEERE